MKSREEVVAGKLYDLLSDHRIESYLVGRYFAQSARVEVYDKFEEMVESARQEKQDRVEWLKKIIIGDKMETTLENKCVILIELEMGFFDDEEFFPIIDKHPLAFSIAESYTNGLVTELTGAGQNAVEEAFSELLTFLGVVDTGFEHLADFFLPNYDSED